MFIARPTLICFHSAILSFVCASSALPAGEAPTQPHTHWHTMPWPGYWWIFPFIFFVLMVVVFIYMMRRGDRGWMCWRRWMDRPEFRDTMKQSWGEPSASAMEILNKRYAKGEIDKQEYEEKKAAINRSE